MKANEFKCYIKTIKLYLNEKLMDTDRVHTFLEIVRSGSFIRASEKLHVTQTTVSARIRTLEEELGRQLFVRNRSGARLTPAGEDFRKYALTLVQVWERARYQLSLPPGRDAFVSIGGELSLWNPLMLDWLIHVRETQPNLAIRTQVALPDQLMELVHNGVMDIGVMYAPRIEPGLKIDLLREEKLILVRSTRVDETRPEPEFIYVDWGPQFAAQQKFVMEGSPDPSLFVGLGPLGLAYMLRAGGQGYFRYSVAKPYIERGELEQVDGAPEITYPAYVIYSEAADEQAIGPALQALHYVAETASTTSFREVP